MFHALRFMHYSLYYFIRVYYEKKKQVISVLQKKIMQKKDLKLFYTIIDLVINTLPET